MSSALTSVFHRVVPITAAVSACGAAAYGVLSWLAFDASRAEDRLPSVGASQELIMITGFGCVLLGVISVTARVVATRLGDKSLSKALPLWVKVAWLPCLVFLGYVMAHVIHPLLRPFTR